MSDGIWKLAWPLQKHFLTLRSRRRRVSKDEEVFPS